ncbi:MAG: phosphotransferase [Patescibacteria group bacterium]
MRSPEATEEPKNGILINGENFTLVLERERGVGLYANTDRSKYLRIGTSAMVKKELSFHKLLLAENFPVAQILDEGEKDGMNYWIEESLGDTHLTNQFYEDTKATGEVSERRFDVFLGHVASMRDAEARIAVAQPYDFSELARAVGESGMEEELPEFAERIKLAWEKAKQTVEKLPKTLTHGDFNPTNILDRGVIDFGDHFEGPLGFDMVNAITSPIWFPKGPGYEFFQKFDFTDEQIEEFFTKCGTSITANGNFDLRDSFDALFFLKANWWTVRNHKMPKLQEWRYEIYREIVETYLAGQSLYEYWRNKD